MQMTAPFFGYGGCWCLVKVAIMNESASYSSTDKVTCAFRIVWQLKSQRAGSAT